MAKSEFDDAGRRGLAFATGRRVLGALVVLVAAGSSLFRYGPYPELAPLPEESPGLGPTQLRAFLSELGEDGREAYLLFQGVDLLNPVLTAGFAVLLLAWILRRSGLGTGGARLALLIPVAALLADWLENLILSLAIRAYPAHRRDGSAASGVDGQVRAVRLYGPGCHRIRHRRAMGRSARAAGPVLTERAHPGQISPPRVIPTERFALDPLLTA